MRLCTYACAGVCVKWSWCCHNYCVCVCVWFFSFFLLSLFVTLYIFLHLTAMYSSTFGKGWVSRSCLYLLVWVSFGSFSLRELTCMHRVYLALWTRKVLCGSFLCAIYKFSFIHSFIHSSCVDNNENPPLHHLPQPMLPEILPAEAWPWRIGPCHQLALMMNNLGMMSDSLSDDLSLTITICRHLFGDEELSTWLGSIFNNLWPGEQSAHTKHR